MRIEQTSGPSSVGVNGIFKKDGVYHLRLLFPWDNQFVNIALHGVPSYADALKVLQFLCSRITDSALLNFQFQSGFMAAT
jgi:hypothetical protein